jgi:hypothetical protein
MSGGYKVLSAISCVQLRIGSSLGTLNQDQTKLKGGSARTKGFHGVCIVGEIVDASGRK